MGAAGPVLAVALLIGVLGFAVVRPRGLPEAVAAVPAAAVVVVLGLVSPHAAWAETRTLLPVVAFLVAVLALSHLCDAEGLFAAAGDLMARLSRGRPQRLLGAVFVVASVVTAVLSLDATVVLSEASRVARSGVVIKDHLREGWLAQATLAFMDWCGNIGDGVPLPYNFLSRSEWQGAFLRSKLHSLMTNEKLDIYLPPARWLFDRQLHFVSFLEPRTA